MEQNNYCSRFHSIGTICLKDRRMQEPLFVARNVVFSLSTHSICKDSRSVHQVPFFFFSLLFCSFISLLLINQFFVIEYKNQEVSLSHPKFYLLINHQPCHRQQLNFSSPCSPRGKHVHFQKCIFRYKMRECKKNGENVSYPRAVFIMPLHSACSWKSCQKPSSIDIKSYFRYFRP